MDRKATTWHARFHRMLSYSDRKIRWEAGFVIWLRSFLVVNRYNWTLTNATVFGMSSSLINETTCRHCYKATSLVSRTSAGNSQPQTPWVTDVGWLLKAQVCLSLKDSIIQQGKVYSTDKMTMKILRIHPSLWQVSPEACVYPILATIHCIL